MCPPKRGVVAIDGQRYAYAGGNSPAATADATNPRVVCTALQVSGNAVVPTTFATTRRARGQARTDGASYRPFSNFCGRQRRSLRGCEIGLGIGLRRAPAARAGGRNDDENTRSQSAV